MFVWSLGERGYMVACRGQDTQMIRATALETKPHLHEWLAGVHGKFIPHDFIIIVLQCKPACAIRSVHFPNMSVEFQPVSSLAPSLYCVLRTHGPNSKALEEDMGGKSQGYWHPMQLRSTMRPVPWDQNARGLPDHLPPSRHSLGEGQLASWQQ